MSVKRNKVNRAVDVLEGRYGHFYGSLSEFREQLRVAVAKVPEKFHDLITVDLSSVESYDNSSEATLKLCYTDVETDAEVEARLDQESKREDYRKKQYLLLKKEFEGK